MQLRPCFLVVDAEHAGSISTRKLVLETAKYNVITAYSCEEAVQVLERFPRVHGVVVNGSMHDEHAPQLWQAMLTFPEVKLIVVGETRDAMLLRTPDVVVQSFSPAKLLEALPPLFPRQAEYLAERENDLEQRQV